MLSTTGLLVLVVIFGFAALLLALPRLLSRGSRGTHAQPPDPTAPGRDDAPGATGC